MYDFEGCKISHDRFTELKDRDVLTEYDGPRAFIESDAEGHKYYFHFSAEDNERIRYLVVPCNDRIVSNLCTSTTSARLVLMIQAWFWVVDFDHDGIGIDAWLSSFDDIPDGYKPRNINITLP